MRTGIKYGAGKKLELEIHAAKMRLQNAGNRLGSIQHNHRRISTAEKLQLIGQFYEDCKADLAFLKANGQEWPRSGLRRRSAKAVLGQLLSDSGYSKIQDHAAQLTLEEV